MGNITLPHAYGVIISISYESNFLPEMSDMFNERSKKPHVGERGGELLDITQEKITGVPGFEARGGRRYGGGGGGRGLDLTPIEAGMLARRDPFALHAELMKQAGVASSVASPAEYARFQSLLTELRKRVLGMEDATMSSRTHRLLSMKRGGIDVNKILVQDPETRAMESVQSLARKYLGAAAEKEIELENAFRQKMVGVGEVFNHHQDNIKSLAAAIDPKAESKPSASLERFELSVFDGMRDVSWKVEGCPRMSYSEALSLSMAELITMGYERNGVFTLDAKSLDVVNNRIALNRFGINYSGLSPDEKLLLGDIVNNSYNILRLFGYGGKFNTTLTTKGLGDQSCLLHHFDKVIKSNPVAFDNVWAEMVPLGSGKSNFFEGRPLLVTLPDYYSLVNLETPLIGGRTTNETIHNLIAAGRFSEIEWGKMPNLLENYMIYFGASYRIFDTIKKSAMSPDDSWHKSNFLTDFKKDAGVVLALFYDNQPDIDTEVQSLCYGLASSILKAVDPDRKVAASVKVWDPDNFRSWKELVVGCGFLPDRLASLALKRIGLDLNNPASIMVKYMSARTKNSGFSR